MEMKMNTEYVVMVDLGRTKIATASLDRNGKVLRRVRYQIQQNLVTCLGIPVLIVNDANAAAGEVVEKLLLISLQG